MNGDLLTLDPAGRRISLDAADPRFHQDPYPVYRTLHERCRVFFWEEYGHWCLAGFEEVDAVLKDRRFGRDVLHVATRAELNWPEPPAHLAPFHAVEAHSMLEREPPVHTRLRGQVARAFVARRIELLRPGIEALADELIDRFPRGRPFDLLPAFCTPIPVVAICGLLGVPVAMAPQLLEWSHRMVAMYQFRRTRAVEDAAVAATLAFAAFLRSHLAQKRASPGDDLISHLIGDAAGPERLSDDELVSTCILLLNAGHEATVHGLGNAVKTLLQHQADPRTLFASDRLAAATVEEVLRFAPPLHMFCRHALEDLSLGELELRRGERIGLLLGAAGRDPRCFDRPDRFLPGRADSRHLAFGAGIHFCLGASLARLEMRTALARLFERIPGLALASAPRCQDSWHFHGLRALDVVA